MFLLKLIIRPMRPSPTRCSCPRLTLTDLTYLPQRRTNISSMMKTINNNIIIIIKSMRVKRAARPLKSTRITAARTRRIRFRTCPGTAPIVQHHSHRICASPCLCRLPARAPHATISKRPPRFRRTTSTKMCCIITTNKTTLASISIT